MYNWKERSTYTDTKVRRAGRKTAKTHTCTHTYIPLLYLDSTGTVLRQPRPYGDKGGVKTCFLKSLANLLLLEILQAKDKSMGVYGGTAGHGRIDFITVTNALCSSHKPAQESPSKAEKARMLHGFITQWIYHRKRERGRERGADLFYLPRCCCEWRVV